MNGGRETEAKQKGFSLSLKGVTTKKSAFDRNLVRDVEIKEETDLVTEIVDDTIKSSREPVKKKEFIIPAIEDDNVFRNALVSKYGVESRNNRGNKRDLSGDIKREIKREPRSPSPESARLGASKPDLKRGGLGEMSTLDDYERMPVGEFGLAMLRGMGCNPEKAEEEGWAKPVEIKLRPKGLGLGADVQSSTQKEHMEQAKRSNNAAAPLIVKCGAYVKILRGPHEGKYGQVEGMDEDAGRLHINLALSKEKVSCNEAFVAAVTKEEFNDRGRCLNWEKYDDYKRKNEIAPVNESKFDVGSLAQSDIELKSKQKDKKKSKACTEKRPFIGYWLRSQIRVRIIDEKFKKGKYLDQKVVVEDVLSRDTCICRTDQGQLLENVHMDMLETVLPRTSCQAEVPVVVVAGDLAGQMGHIVDRDKKKSRAYVRFETDDSIHKIDFDSLCEYVGDL